MFALREGNRRRLGAVTGSLVALAWFAVGCGPTGSRHVKAGQITADADTEEGGTGGGTPTGGRPAVDASPNTGAAPRPAGRPATPGAAAAPRVVPAAPEA